MLFSDSVYDKLYEACAAYEEKGLPKGVKIVDTYVMKGREMTAYYHMKSSSSSSGVVVKEGPQLSGSIFQKLCEDQPKASATIVAVMLWPDPTSEIAARPCSRLLTRNELRAVLVHVADDDDRSKSSKVVVPHLWLLQKFVAPPSSETKLAAVVCRYTKGKYSLSKVVNRRPLQAGDPASHVTYDGGFRSGLRASLVKPDAVTVDSDKEEKVYVKSAAHCNDALCALLGHNAEEDGPLSVEVYFRKGARGSIFILGCDWIGPRPDDVAFRLFLSALALGSSLRVPSPLDDASVACLHVPDSFTFELGSSTRYYYFSRQLQHPAATPGVTLTRTLTQPQLYP